MENLVYRIDPEMTQEEMLDLLDTADLDGESVWLQNTIRGTIKVVAKVGEQAATVVAAEIMMTVITVEVVVILIMVEIAMNVVAA